MVNNVEKNVKTNFFYKLAFTFIFLLILFFCGNGKITNSKVMAASKDKLYLSDIQYMDSSYAASGHLIIS